MSVYVSPMAHVDPRAQLEDEVYIGPFCTVGAEVHLGRGTRLENNVTLMGRVRLGCHNRVYPGAVIGAEPQDLSYGGAPTEVVIGSHNVIRECVTIHRGTERGQGVTRVGDHNLLMACCHVAHDCTVGNHTVVANGTLLGGHVWVEDHAVLSGNVAVHQFVTVGAYSFVGGVSGVRQDVPPFLLVDGNPARPKWINAVGLQRHGFPRSVIAALHEAFRLLYRSRCPLDQVQSRLEPQGHWVPEVQRLVRFLEGQRQGQHGRARERRQAA